MESVAHAEFLRRKAILRRSLRAWRAGLPPAEVGRRSQALAGHLMAHPLWRRARTLAAFVGVGGEPDTGRLMRAAVAAGKDLWLPRIESLDPAVMVFGRVTDPELLTAGRLGIPEPNPDGDERSLHELSVDLVLVPGVAFSKDGARLGQGKGFYDGALQYMPEAITVGVAFDEAVDPSQGPIPMGPRDVRVKYLATESGIVVCRRPG